MNSKWTGRHQIDFSKVEILIHFHFVLLQIWRKILRWSFLEREKFDNIFANLVQFTVRATDFDIFTYTKVQVW